VSSWSARSTPATPPHAKVLTLPQAAPELARSWGQNSSLSPTAPYAKALEVPGGKRSRTGVLPGCSAAMDGSGSGWTGRHVHAVEIRKNPADGGLVGRAGTGEHRSTLALNPRVRGSSPWRRTTENGLRPGVSRRIGVCFVCAADWRALGGCSGAVGPVPPPVGLAAAIMDAGGRPAATAISAVVVPGGRLIERVRQVQHRDAVCRVRPAAVWRWCAIRAGIPPEIPAEIPAGVPAGIALGMLM
jgi:hypothetical protein